MEASIAEEEAFCCPDFRHQLPGSDQSTSIKDHHVLLGALSGAYHYLNRMQAPPFGSRTNPGCSKHRSTNDDLQLEQT
jgi:hypothetical protein